MTQTIYTAITRYPKSDLENEYHEAETLEAAQASATEAAAINCFHTIEVVDGEQRTVKGPYPIKAREPFDV